MSEDVDHMGEPDDSVTGKNAKSWGDYRQLGELTPANLISFGWQIASGMVSVWMSNYVVGLFLANETVLSIHLLPVLQPNY